MRIVSTQNVATWRLRGQPDPSAGANRRKKLPRFNAQVSGFKIPWIRRWIPAFAGMTSLKCRHFSETRCFYAGRGRLAVIPAKAGIHFGQRIPKLELMDTYAPNQSSRSTFQSSYGRMRTRRGNSPGMAETERRPANEPSASCRRFHGRGIMKPCSGTSVSARFAGRRSPAPGGRSPRCGPRVRRRCDRRRPGRTPSHG